MIETDIMTSPAIPTEPTAYRYVNRSSVPSTNAEKKIQGMTYILPIATFLEMLNLFPGSANRRQMAENINMLSREGFQLSKTAKDYQE